MLLLGFKTVNEDFSTSAQYSRIAISLVVLIGWGLYIYCQTYPQPPWSSQSLYTSCSPRITSTVSKASAGVAEVFPVHQVKDAVRLASSLKQVGWELVSSASSSSTEGAGDDEDAGLTDVTTFRPKGNVLLIVGQFSPSCTLSQLRDFFNLVFFSYCRLILVFVLNEFSSHFAWHWSTFPCVRCLIFQCLYFFL